MAWYHAYQLFLQYIAFAGAACGTVGLFLIWLSRTDFAAIRRIPPPLRCVFALAFIFAAFAAQKQSVRDSLFSASSSSSSPASLSSTTQDNEPDSTTEEDAEGETNDEPVAPDSSAAESNTNCLRIARYAPPPVNELDVAWPNPGYHAEDIRLYGTWNLRTNYVAVAPCTISYFPDLSGVTFGIDWPSAFSNAVTRGVFPQDANLNQGFFAAAWGNIDTDNDGLPDADEIFIHHTDPNVSNPSEVEDDDHDVDEDESDEEEFSEDGDTDNDGVPNWLELRMGFNPEFADSDNDGILDLDDLEDVAWGVGSASVESSTDDPIPPPTAPEMLGSYQVLVTYGENTEDVGQSVFGVSWPSGTNTVDAITSTDIPNYGTNGVFDVEASGVMIRPVVSGWYSFQVASDDQATLHVGEDFAVSGEWSTTNPDGIGICSRRMMLAGTNYPVRVEWHNNGGPAQLEFPVFAEYEPFEPPQVAVGFSSSAVIGSNSSGPGVHAQLDEMTLLTIDAYGGELGGVLTVDIDHPELLEYVLRDELPQGEIALAPYEHRRIQGLYRGILPNRARSVAQESDMELSVVAAVVESLTDTRTAKTARLAIGPSTVTNACVKTIKFNHDLDSSVIDGVNIRFSRDERIHSLTGEWNVDKARNEPVCYVAGTTGVVIKADIDLKRSIDTNLVVEVTSDGFPCSGFAAKSVRFTQGVAKEVEFVATNAVIASVAKDTGSLKWKIKDLNIEEETGPHPYYVILDTPKPPWSTAANRKNNVWASALDVACVAAFGQTQKSAALSGVTSHLFGEMGCVYDSENGAPNFKISTGFNLSGYLNVKGTVNCFDQAYAVQALGSLIGIEVKIWKTDPFGYIRTTRIVGVNADCNNPFFLDADTGYCSNEVCTGQEEDHIPGFERSSFSRHFYNEYDGKIYDACAGPQLGTKTRSEYLRDVIERPCSRPTGSVFDDELGGHYGIR